jgi:serine/threonine-protein kinase HipA
LPEIELREFILRDVLDIALGNTDNHARNTALLKELDGALALSPLFDFAPMALDPQGIARVCRWPDEDGGIPDWNALARTLESLGLSAGAVRTHLGSLADTINDLPRIMADERVPKSVIETFADRTARVAASLASVKP